MGCYDGDSALGTLSAARLTSRHLREFIGGCPGGGVGEVAAAGERGVRDVDHRRSHALPRHESSDDESKDGPDDGMRTAILALPARGAPDHGAACPRGPRSGASSARRPAPSADGLAGPVTAGCLRPVDPGRGPGPRGDHGAVPARPALRRARPTAATRPGLAGGHRDDSRRGQPVRPAPVARRRGPGPR
jgi:hypothetical protein